MSKTSKEMQEWMGSFGREYTSRCTLSVEELEALYKRMYGISRIELNERFLKGMARSVRVLEVGSNTGNQLLCLQRTGFTNLYGIEVQDYAVELSKLRTSNISIIQGSAFDIPFKDGYFDLVFTSGLLIHIHPADSAVAMAEIHRCTRKYIWGLEYYAPECTEVNYRGHNNLLWKADYVSLYLKEFDDLELVREERLKYLDNDNVDSMFLLKKR